MCSAAAAAATTTTFTTFFFCLNGLFFSTDYSRSRQVPHRLFKEEASEIVGVRFLYRLDALHVTQPTVSKDDMFVCLFARGLTALSAQMGYIAP